MRGHRHSTIVPASVGPWIRAFATFAVLLSLPAFADPINGRVAGGGAPIAGSTVTLWAASAGPPKQLAETRTDTDGRFNLNSDSSDAMLYLTAKGGQPVAAKTGGDNPAITMLAVIGSKPPASVVINEMTTIASVWTHVQFLNGDAIKGNPLGIKIAAGNVPNFADLQSGGWGTTIQDSLNGGQTPTMANFATLAEATTSRDFPPPIPARPRTSRPVGAAADLASTAAATSGFQIGWATRCEALLWWGRPS